MKDCPLVMEAANSPMDWMLSIMSPKNYSRIFEMEFGLTIEKFGVHCDSGGAGRHQGGCGIIRDIRFA